MKHSYLLFLCCLSLNWASAQTIRVSGTVRDKQAGDVIPGVTVLKKGSANGTVTDANGRYSISVSNSAATLVFNLIGYAAQAELVGTRSSIDVELVQQTSSLTEIVVTALGVQRQSRDLGYSVQKLEGAEISEVKSANFLDNLAGRVAGVTVSHGSTGVGSTSKIDRKSVV